MNIEIARRFFLRSCCTPKIDCLIEYNDNWDIMDGCVLEPTDILIGKYVSPNPYDKETYFSSFGIYTYFNRKLWRLIKYSVIQSIDIFPHTSDYFYNLTNPYFIIQTQDDQTIPLYIRPQKILRFEEIFRIDKFIGWAMHHARKNI